MPSRPKHQNLEPLASSSSYEVCQNNYNRRRNQNANISYKAANPRFAEGQWDEVVSKLQVEKPMHRDNFMLRVEFTPFSRFATSLSHRVARQRRSFNFALRAKGRYQRWARVLWTEGTARERFPLCNQPDFSTKSLVPVFAHLFIYCCVLLMIE
jgi:hypothetical protein